MQEMQHRSLLHMAPERWLFSALAIFCLAIIALSPYSFSMSAQGQASPGDARHGQEVFQRRCISCHNLDSEKEGPRLRGVFGRKSASVASFSYSDALKGAKLTWDADTLEKWLADSDKFIPDSDMNLVVKNPQERADIIAYLKQLSSQ